MVVALDNVLFEGVPVRQSEGNSGILWICTPFSDFLPVFFTNPASVVVDGHHLCAAQPVYLPEVSSLL